MFSILTHSYKPTNKHLLPSSFSPFLPFPFFTINKASDIGPAFCLSFLFNCKAGSLIPLGRDYGKGP